MPDRDGQAVLLRLLTWLSPAFPVGAFAYSHGLESAIEAGLVSNRASLTDWLGDLVEHGSGWNDAVLLAAAWRAGSAAELEEISDLGEALAGSRERHMETMLQGSAFLSAAQAWPHPGLPRSDALPYSVAVGAVAAAHGVPLIDVLTAYLHAFCSNLVQVALRLVPLGQSDGLRTLAALEPAVLDLVARAASSTLDDLGSATMVSEIMSLRHETQHSRVFRS